MLRTGWFFLLAIVMARCVAAQQPDSVLPGTKPLTWEGDIAARMLDGVDRFLMREIEQSPARRTALWTPDTTDPKAYAASLSPLRQQLAEILGIRDARPAVVALEYIATPEQPALVGRGTSYDVFAVRWPAFADVTGQGLLLVPRGAPASIRADVIALPDAEQCPEQLVGLLDGIARQSQFARRLAESGCRVLVPVLIDRRLEKRNERAEVTSREFIYRSAFIHGRHIIGYELQKIFAAADWMQASRPERASDWPLGICGWGEGGMLALYAGALDERFSAVSVSGYFAPRETIWQQPIDRNVFGMLERFGDAEVAAMIAPRTLLVEAAKGPEAELTQSGSAPYRLTSPKLDDVQHEFARLEQYLAPLGAAAAPLLVVSGDGQGPFASEAALSLWLDRLGSILLAPPEPDPQHLRAHFDPASQQQQQLYELDRHNQQVLAESPYERAKFMERLDTRSPEAFAASVEPYRDYFRDNIVGHFPYDRLPLNPRTRKAYEGNGWTGYEVLLDVFPDVTAYGVLLLPDGIASGERRPVVVCQHGLEGRPADVITGDSHFYHGFAAKLAERGYITFAPQNLYVLGKHRPLQRKAYPLKKTIFSVMVPQHQQIVAWLRSLPQVDPERMAFYGLSYGGVSAMRIPPLVPEYRLAICSANFNDWVVKTSSSRVPYGYVGTAEYEIFEFNLGGTFNYAEMAALIAPRPFMIERGHFDGVGTDDLVAAEFAKVRHLYQARLKLDDDRCRIEWFPGHHEIHGEGTFEFLDQFLK